MTTTRGRGRIALLILAAGRTAMDSSRLRMAAAACLLALVASCGATDSTPPDTTAPTARGRSRALRLGVLLAGLLVALMLFGCGTTPPANRAPVADGASMTTAEDTPLVLALTASDADGDPLTFAVMTLPSHGMLSGAAPNLTYTPNANYNGSDSFTFKANDGAVDSNIASLTIAVTPVNDPPVAPNQSVSTPEDTQRTITLAANDADGDSLSYTVASAPGNGSVDCVTTGACTYIPNLNFSGADGFTFKASDGTADSDVAEVSITVGPVNDAPAIDGAPLLVIGSDQTYGFTPTATDVDADPLVFSILNRPPWAAFSTTTGSLTGTPTEADVGIFDAVTISVSDGSVVAALPAFSITVVDATPPEGVSRFYATPGDGQIELSWTSPVAEDLAGVLVRRSPVGWPESPSEGELVAEVASPGELVVDGDLANGTRYFYSAFAYDEVPNHAPAARAMAVAGRAPFPAAAGSLHSLAVSLSGTVWAWGDSRWGQLGDGTVTSRSRPVPVCGSGTVAPCASFLDGVVAVAAGESHSLALKGDGTLWAWGLGANGQAGLGGSSGSLTPAQVVGEDGVGFLTDVVAVAAGPYFSVALKRDGTVWAWGANFDGELGNGTTGMEQYTPVQVCDAGESVPCASFLSEVIGVAAGNQHAMALKSDGTVWAWGNNSVGGNLGDGTMTDRLTPVQVCAAGEYAPCASYLTGVAAIAAGRFWYSLALKGDGTVWGVGLNNFGMLGDGTLTDRLTPVQVCAPGENAPCQNFLTGVAAISAGGLHNVALKSDGTIWSWGRNYEGQVGDGTISDTRFVPVQVCAAGETAPCTNSLTAVEAVAAGGKGELEAPAHSIAVKSDGTVWAWGSNGSGQLGDGTSADSPVPVQVGVFSHLPDLAVQIRGVTIEGANVTIHYRVSNQSLIDAGPFTVGVWGNSFPAPVVGDGTYGGSKSFPGLISGGSLDDAAVVSSPLASGEAYVIVDPDDVVTESAEGNNVSVSWAWPPTGIIDQEQPVIDRLSVGSAAIGGSSGQVLAQVITAGKSGELKAVRVPVACSSGDLIVEIQGVGGEQPDGTTLTSQSVPASNLPGYLSGPIILRNLSFSLPIVVSAGDRIAIVLSSTGECGIFQGPEGNPYPGGDAFFIAAPNQPGAWYPLGASRADLPFQTVVDAP